MPIVDTIYRNPSRWRAVIHTQDVRHGTAGCLLSLVLLAPLFVRQFGMVTIATAVLTYSLLIVPALTNYFSPLKIIMKFIRKITDIIAKARFTINLKYLEEIVSDCKRTVAEFFQTLWTIIILILNIITLPFTCFFYCFVHSVHGFYLAFEGFRTTSTQIIFFMLCEKYLSPEARFSSLHFLLFYTVLAYLQRSLVTRQWSHSFYESNITDFLRLTTYFIAVRLAKGVAMAFVLIIFTMQFNNVEPNLTFIVVTFTYFVATQKKWEGNENLISWFRMLQLNVLEEEEDYWVPFLIKTLPIGASLTFILMNVSNHYLLCFIAFYTNFLAPINLLKMDYEERNFSHNVPLMSFRMASKEDLLKYPTCPVCLDAMRVARVTYCNHVYHAVCLRKCLAISPLCPLCKRSLSSHN